MISICIPIYNCNIYNLTVSLAEQCHSLQIPFEIILIDDASGPECIKTNAILADISNVKYIMLEQNIGRAAIRNRFLNHAQYDYLLFMDCDSKLPDNKFVYRYVKEAEKGRQVVCGGRLYPDKPANKEFLLRWKYGIARECVPAVERMKKPFDSFLSNNFLIRKDLFEKGRFDERIRNYGHEDTLFGYYLRKNGAVVTHIDNPLIHKYSENTGNFFQKTREAVQNLYFIHSQIIPGNDFDQTVKLLRIFVVLRKLNLHYLLAIASFTINPLIVGLYRYAGFSRLFLFDFYKLAYLCFCSAAKK